RLEIAQNVTRDGGQNIEKGTAVQGIAGVRRHPGAEKYLEEEGVDLPLVTRRERPGREIRRPGRLPARRRQPNWRRRRCCATSTPRVGSARISVGGHG